MRFEPQLGIASAGIFHYNTQHYWQLCLHFDGTRCIFSEVLVLLYTTVYLLANNTAEIAKIVGGAVH